MKRVPLIAFSVAMALNAKVFDLGRVEVISNTNEGSQKSDSNIVVINSEQMKKEQIKRLSEVAESVAGLYVDKKGPRAEQNFYIRGFDARRVPLYIDGVPVYNPYDGNSDFGRFTTFDLSRIDISKGSSSVLYGANTMGGAINLVSKKPTKELEGTIGYGMEMGRSSKTYGRNIDFSIGSKQDKFYAQVSGSSFEDKGQQLSSDFKKDPNGNEDGDRREHSKQKDSKIHLKVGLTPNDSDEYVLTYTKQTGKKEQPAYAGRYTDYNKTAKRYWNWPIWDKDSVYWLSHTDLDKIYLKTKAYYDTYQNELKFYKDKTYTTPHTKNKPSHYDDKTYGASVEVGGDVVENSTLKVAVNYKFDEHKEHNDGEPEQTMQDKTYSFGVENSYKFSEMTKLIVGVSHDTRDAVKAEEYGKPLSGGTERLFDFNVSKKSAFNYQIAIKHSFDDSDELKASFAKKSYFASMKEHYSERFKKIRQTHT